MSTFNESDEEEENALLDKYDKLVTCKSQDEMAIIVAECETEILEDINDTRSHCDIPSSVFPIHMFKKAQDTYFYPKSARKTLHKLFFNVKKKKSDNIVAYFNAKNKGRHKLSTLQANNTSFRKLISSIFTIADGHGKCDLSTLTKDQLHTMVMFFNRIAPKQCYKALQKAGAPVQSKYEFWKNAASNSIISEYVNSVDLDDYNDNDSDNEERAEGEEMSNVKEYFYILLVGEYLEDGEMVYVFKIGKTNNVYKRIDEHTTSGQFIDVTIIAIISVDNASKLEDMMKDYWKQYNITNKKEWTSKFSTELYKIKDIMLLVDFIKKANEIADKLNNSDKVTELTIKNAALEEKNIDLMEEKLKMEEDNVDLMEKVKITKQHITNIKKLCNLLPDNVSDVKQAIIDVTEEVLLT